MRKEMGCFEKELQNGFEILNRRILKIGTEMGPVGGPKSTFKNASKDFKSAQKGVKKSQSFKKAKTESIHGPSLLP